MKAERISRPKRSLPSHTQTYTRPKTQDRFLFLGKKPLLTFPLTLLLSSHVMTGKKDALDAIALNRCIDSCPFFQKPTPQPQRNQCRRVKNGKQLALLSFPFLDWNHADWGREAGATWHADQGRRRMRKARHARPFVISCAAPQTERERKREPERTEESKRERKHSQTKGRQKPRFMSAKKRGKQRQTMSYCCVS